MVIRPKGEKNMFTFDALVSLWETILKLLRKLGWDI